jgi:hypothetical protein
VPVLVGVLAVVSVLCIGGGAAAYLVLTGERSPTGRPAAVGSPSAVESADGSAAAAPGGTAAATTPSATRPPAGKEEEVSGDLSTFKKGDCLTVDEANDNRVGKVTCVGPGAQKVLLRKGGTLDDSVCRSVNASFSLSQDGPGSTRDFVLCVGPAD